MVEKLEMKTARVSQENIEKIRALFPNAVTEVKRDGRVELAVDFDVLKQELSDTVIEAGQERYQMTWPDKRKAVALANSAISATLRPCKEESVDFDTTENLYIEGDNLDVLKLLRETYLGKVKMIYIDPPYNTNNDSFVYNDCYSMDEEEFLKAGGYYDENGNRVVDIKVNNESNGRFHTDWLNMIYPRLKVARDLLTDDGVIFISIDDNEQANLKKICDEIFGERNFVTDITREAIKGGSVSKYIRNVNDYVLVYAKNINELVFEGIEVEGLELKFEDEKGKYAKGRELNKWGVGARREDSPGMWFSVPGPNGEEVFPIRNDGSEGRWRLSRENMLKLINNNDVLYEKRQNGTYIIYEKIRNDSARQKQFTNLFINQYTNSKGSEELKNLFGTSIAIFDFAKPVELIKSFLIMNCNSNKDSVILDFFSGSATTAHAVMQLNAEDGGKRKFIMVQLPEKCDEKSEAYKAGYKNICEIGKERIRRAGKKIKEESPLTTQDLDTGFRVLKLDSSNMQDVFYNPNAMTQSLLDSTVDNVKPDRTPLDLLFQVMLELGKPLSAKIEEREVDGKKYYVVDGNDLIACFDDDLGNEVITAIAKQKPLYAVFKDKSFATDSVGINNEQLFKTYSPSTVVKVI